MVLADPVLLLPKFKVPAAALSDLLLDDHDEGHLLLSLRVGELDDGRGDDDIVDVVPVVPVVSVVSVVPIIPVIALVAVIPIVIVATSNDDYSSGIK